MAALSGARVLSPSLRRGPLAAADFRGPNHGGPSDTGVRHPRRRKQSHPAPARDLHTAPPASGPQASRALTRRSTCAHLRLFCASLSKMCPEVSGSLKRLFFSECSDIFSCKLRVIASALIKGFLRSDAGETHNPRSDYSLPLSYVCRST